MKTPVERLHYGDFKLDLILGDEYERYVELNGIQYISLEQLLSVFPSILKDNESLALITNFFFGGLNYTIIEDIQEYQQNYLQRFKKEMESQPEGFSLIQYGEFDVSKMTPPQFKDNILSFFVESVNFGIPYQVKCTFSESECHCSYSLLDLKR